jgi:hypothetical protein
MFNDLVTIAFRRLGGVPAYQIYGKTRREPAWRVIDVQATSRRDLDSRWPAPFWPGTCITWSSAVIAVGWDFALNVYREQCRQPATREQPLEVAGGRLHHAERRRRAGAASFPSASEVLAHECGHTGQAIRLDIAYLPTGALFTLFREGPRWVNWFENAASEQGQFGGIVHGSVSTELLARL